MNEPIIFLAPEAYAGLTGYQVVDDEQHVVVDVIFEDGTSVPPSPAYSYKGRDA